ncbi:MAG: polysaccharide deacetylase family protein [Bacilli bacterium]|nr:polysaccharide deacetylase family protein [Bacilli bacterium]
MKRYQKKHNKKHKLHADMIIIFILIIAIIIVLTCISIVKFRMFTSNNSIIEQTRTISGINKDNYQKYFNYSGNVVSENVIDNHYLSVLYEENGNYQCHFIDLYLGKEITINDFIKKKSKASFDSKINSLLKLKYPTSVIKEIDKMDKAYFLGEKELYIYYNNTNQIETSRKFNLKVDYNEIKDYITFVPSLNKNYQNEDGYNYDPNKISVAFTFDDGPSENNTLNLIKSLEDYKMSATFFMVGYKYEKYADIIKKVEESHSEVGYHSYSHTRFTQQTSSQIISDFANSDRIFYKITGNHLKLTRPPYGSYNADVLNSIDNAFIRWNIDTNDWQYKDVNYIVNYVLDNIKNHAIILFHDSYETSVEAASILMEKLYYKDIQVVSVSKLAELTNTILENHNIYYSFD